MFTMDRKKVKESMAERSCTQKELANEIHVSQPHINDVLNGYKEPSLKVVCEIAKYLGVTIDTLVKEE